MNKERRYDLDWIRIAGMGAVFCFHVMMFFNSWNWHAKNVITSADFAPVGRAMLTWLMPVFFLVSGFATRQVLTVRSRGEFVKERLLRLGVPILAGAFLLSPHQVYAERVTYGQFDGSFWAFLPRYFDGLYYISPTGNFAWMGLHLWYLLVLLLFSLLTLPFLRPQAEPDKEGSAIAGPLGLVLVPVGLLLLDGLLRVLGLDLTQSGWPFGLYLVFYLLGYHLLASAPFRATVKQWGGWALAGGIFAMAIVAFVPIIPEFSLTTAGLQFVKMAASWWSMVGFLYLADRYLNRNSPTLQYWGEATMPFYVLHQPVIVGLGFAMRSAPLPIALKFPLLLVGSFLTIMALYHLMVRSSNPLRILMGMRANPHSRSVAARSA